MKRILITILLILCVWGGHYFLYTTPIGGFRHYISISLTAAIGCLGLFGALTLVLQSDGLRLRKICAFQIGMIALASLVSMAAFLLQPPEAPPTKLILSPALMLYGNTYAFICILYPLELIRPGWLNFRRGALLYLPVITMGLIYFIVVRMPTTDLPAIKQWSDLPANIRVFDIGFRLTVFIYPVWLFVRTLRYKTAYDQWCENNCSSKENKSLDLLNNYNTAFLLILISYIIVTMTNNSQSRLLHGLLFLLFIGYLLYQNLYNIIPVANELRSPFYTKNANEGSDALLANGNSNLEMEQHSFIGKIPQYKAMLERWMLTEEPYKDSQFKLLDCMAVLPLNRSYLSRLFNEGYNETFFAFVMRHRIEKSVILLNTHPELTIACISEMCGFSSPSVFGRAFLKHKGVTPLQYRKRAAS